MNKFTKKKSNLFTRTVSVLLEDDSECSLEVTMRKMPLEETDKLIFQGGDLVLCKAVLESVGDIPVEDTDPQEVISGKEALDLVMQNGCCVGAIAREYIEVTRGRNFRGTGSRPGR